MRLWHKDLIRVLPRPQLLGQWGECCAIAKNIAEKGTPNHMLVNKVIEYPDSHFIDYCARVVMEMKRRGYNVSDESFRDCLRNTLKGYRCGAFTAGVSSSDKIFDGWHNERYLKQCYYNLQEKYDCGGISEEEWKKIEEVAK